MFQMCGYRIVPKSSAASVSLFIEEKGTEAFPRIGLKEDEFLVLLLHAAVTLINSCTIEQLEKIPRKLSESLLLYFKKLWADAHKQMLCGNILKFNQGRHSYVTNIRTNTLAENIFRLSINAGQFTRPSNFKKVERSIFSSSGTTFEDFVLNHWEVSPLLMRRPSKALTKEDDIFSSFLQHLSSEGVLSFIHSILQNLTSCPAIASDELSVLSFLKEVENHLGCPIIYQQDIRVLKTEHSEREMHYFQECLGSSCSQAPHFLYMDNVLRCKEAYKEGYTITLRGMEFRFESIAAIADGLASLFGQPSAGVNMYLTPPDSQGLARHYDDHCVLVCQLLGVKKWKVFSSV
ncbi:unnamed protein product [Ilex paraguariensis]|uniref:Bifunctional lysine-specific demethylase and histidyl-hydroxylase n=1 Tax=Ilex paraguariensis TaxID=185542 RepID=A0ABC8UUV8_9AQUA